MTALETLFRTAMVGDPTLGPLLAKDGGGNPAFYLDQLIQNPVYPAGRFQRITTHPYYVHSPASPQGSTGWCRFQVDFWTNGANAAFQREQLCRALLGALALFNAWALPGSPVITGSAPSFLLNRIHTVEPQVHPPLYKAILDVKVFYQDQ